MWVLKGSSGDIPWLFKFGTDFTGDEKNNHEELENTIGLIRKDFFYTFSRKKIFWKNDHFCCFLAIMRDSQNANEIKIFVPDVFYFCAICVHVICAPTCGSYSPEHGDIPRYPNLAKILKIKRWNSPWSLMIFSFWRKKISKRKKISFALHESQMWTYISK